ncbi:type II secretion system protein [Massilia sp. BJB1822]|nr:type II secretion system protein [Massilia sp. BJB1822]
MTLVELVVAMVIIGVSLAGVLTAFSNASTTSTDPMVIKQVTAIAEGMMEEIQRMPFAAQSNDLPANCARDTYNDLQDYNGYNCPVVDVNGNTIAGLAGYTVQVTVIQVAVGSPMFIAAAPANALEINVQVSNGTHIFNLRGWRTNFGAFQLASP